jgi:3-oxoacyl-[acyl-carrier-protein] synthase II
MAGLCALGHDWPTVGARLRAGASGVGLVAEFAEVAGLETLLGARVPGFTTPEHYPRKKTRGMGRVAALATRATELALADAGLARHPWVSDGTLGLAYGSTTGSPPALVDYAHTIGVARTVKGVLPFWYAKMMSHTCAANLAQFFEIKGRVIPTCSACSSGSQAIGVGYEAIRFGRQPLMACGGAEELHATEAALFDLLRAASRRNDAPDATPRPFDADRDGLVVGEGAATLVLEELEHARARGARIHAEILGFAASCDGFDLIRPDRAGMQRAMELGLADAAIPASAVGYVNAHATATDVGDAAESQAMAAVYGVRTPVSSLKGHLGHTLGACGALEAWLTIEMLREGWVAPTRNLERVDPVCAPLDYVMGAPRSLEAEIAVSNNFAFGGVNTSLVLRLPRE